MKIVLKNFRCYENREFDFGDSGLTLLSGQSGAGKSTILMAIKYAITGEGRKLVSHGKTSCSVELSINDMKIKRTSRPNRLVLNDIYEDDAAQAIIDKEFGKVFDSVSYISQNTRDSFVSMSPSEKLEFLERFALDGVDIGELKGRCLNAKKAASLDLNGVSSQLSLLREKFKGVEEPPLIPFPIKCKDREKAIKNEEVRLKNSNILIKRCEKKALELEKTISKLEGTEKSLENFKNLYSKTNEKLELLKRKLEENEYIGDGEFAEIEREYKLAEKQRKILDLRKKLEEEEVRLNDLKTVEEDTKRKTIETLENGLKDIPYTTVELEENVEITEENLELLLEEKRLRSGLCDVKSLERTLEEKEKLLENKRYTLSIGKEVYTCPCCKVVLRIRENKLIEGSEIVTPSENEKSVIKRLEVEIKEITEKIFKTREIEKKLSEIDTEGLDEETLSKELDEFQTLLKKRRGLEAELKFAKSSVSSKAIQAIQKEVERLGEMVRTAGEITILSRTEDELREIYYREMKLKTERGDIERGVERENESANAYKKNIEEIEIEIGKIDGLEEDLKNARGEIEEHINQREKSEGLLKEIERWRESQRERERWVKEKEEIKTLEEKENVYTKKCAAMNLLQAKILEAESIAISNMIQSINSHAQIYLDCFFPDTPISVRLKSFKETKSANSKPQINIEVDYKGMDCDINSLSGGEYSRVVVAFTLALAEIFNTPFLLLDESTASLDQELTTAVIEGLKENFPEKLVVLIAHQVVQGMFNQIVQL